MGTVPLSSPGPAIVKHTLQSSNTANGTSILGETGIKRAKRTFRSAKAFLSLIERERDWLYFPRPEGHFISQVVTWEHPCEHQYARGQQGTPLTQLYEAGRLIWLSLWGNVAMLATGGRNSLGGNNDSVLEGWASNATLTNVIRHSE